MDELFAKYAPAAFLRQVRVAELIEGLDWAFDMDAGEMAFTDPDSDDGEPAMSSPCQVLGSESEGSQTWLWGWANQASQIPDRLLRASRSVRDYGTENAVSELTVPKLDLGRWDGHRLSLIAAGMLDAPGYYRGPYVGGALFVLLEGALVPEPLPRSVATFATGLPSFIAAFPDVDHRLAATGLASALELVTDQSNVVTGADGSATLEFDAAGRFHTLRSKLRDRVVR